MDINQDRIAKIARYYPVVKNGARGVPVSLQVALTDSCFNRCIGCGHPSRIQTKMNVEAYLDFLSGLPRLPESVCYSGGDPMAYPDFNKVMRFHSSRNISFGMTITGYVPPTIDMQLMAEATFVRVSLDAVDAELYTKVRGHTPLHKVLKCIDQMLNLGVPVGLGITVTPENEHHIAEIEQYAADKGITDIDKRLAYPESNVTWVSNTKFARGVQTFEHCSAALYQLYIDSDGSVYPCCITAGDTRSSSQSDKLGNIFGEPWHRIWGRVLNYSRLDVEELPPICRSCCVKRLSEINALCDDLDNQPVQSFF